MEIKKVAEEIAGEAGKKAKEILEEGKKERESILGGAEKEAERKKEELQKEAQRTIEQIRVMETTKARMRSKEIMQKARMRALGDVYREFYSGLDRDKMLKALYDMGSRGVKDVGFVHVSQADVEAAKKLFPDVKAGNMKGGLIIESKDGSEYLNLSMEVIEEMMRQKTFKEVYKLLFGK